MKYVIVVLVLLVGLTGSLSAITIQESILAGDLAAVKAAIDADPGLLLTRNANGQTLLHVAAYNGKLEIARYLIDKGADIVARSSSNSTPMHGAALNGHQEVVRLLVSKGADVNAANASGFTPVINASSSGNAAILRMLIDAGGNVRARTVAGLNALMYAVNNGHTEVARALIAAGAPLDETDNSGSTVLHYAAISGDTALLKICLQRGLPLDGADSSGQTPLLYAAGGAHLDAVKILMSLGANVNAVDNTGADVVQKAIISAFQPTRPEGFLDLIRFLIRSGVNIDRRDPQGYTPLLYSVNLADSVVMGLLIDAGADINISVAGVTPPLISAITQAPPEFVTFGLNRGARTDIRDPHTGATPLHVAVLRGNLPIVQELLARAANVNATDDDGRTPLDFATRYDHKQIAQALKAKGAKSSASNSSVSASLLTQPVADNHATVWYLLGCGYVVKTKNHLLIFDYITGPAGITEPSLSNGHISPAELAGENVFVFTTHEHGDHYESGIWGWRDSLPKLTYVFGFQPELLPENARQGYQGQPYEYVAPRSSKSIADMQVRTIRANDAGVGFVVNVDGLTIYHAGDHAGWLPNQRDGYTSEIDSIAAAVGTVDLAFVNVTGCHVRDTLALAEGTRYTIEKLSPKLVVPTHAFGNEYYYAQFAQKLKPGNPDVLFFCPQHRGDAVRYSRNGDKGKIEAM